MERFAGHYDEWTENRLGWILKNFGDDVFVGRTVLDIGGGIGHVGRRALDLGARAVEVVEGRLANIQAAEPREGLTFTHANLERGLRTASPAYDVVLNLGTIYHVVNWEPMLLESVARARDLAFIETEVIDSDSEATRYVVEDWRYYDQSMSGVGTRPSEFEIDRLLARLPTLKVRKALDSAINAGHHRYDWKNELDGRHDHGLRRFWAVERSPSVDLAAERRDIEALVSEIHRGKTNDTLVIARQTQALAERLLLRIESPPAEAPPPVAAVPVEPLDAREMAETIARMRPLQTGLEVVDGGEERDALDHIWSLPGLPQLRSITDEEGLALYRTIVAEELRDGFEVGTGFGYATAYAGMALERTQGRLVSMDAYAAEGTSIEDALAEASEKLGRGEPPAAMAFAAERLSALGLDEVVTLSLGAVPGSLREALFGRRPDFVLIDAASDALGDLDALLPYLGERCAVFLRDGQAAADAIAALEAAFGTRAVQLPTRHALTVVGRALEGSLPVAKQLFVRARV